MSNIRFSQLPTVVSLKDSDIFAISSPDTSTPPVYTSAQSPISQVAAKIVEGTTFTTSLNTTNKTVAGSINETLSNFANDYSTSSTYAVGDCVLYAGSIYQCTTAIPSGEAWDSTHWTQIKAVDVGSGGVSHNYSTDEQIIGTWIDGSILYEKTAVFTNAVPWATAFQTFADMPIPNINNVIDITYHTKVNEDGNSIYRVYVPSNKLNFLYNLSDGKITGYQQIVSSTGGKNWETVVTVRYTKTSI